MQERKTVLIIDDDPMVLDILGSLLRSDGFEVTCCGDGEAALKSSEEKCFRVVITDYRMPGMDGVALTRHLRTRCPDSFIIGTSVEGRSRDFLEAGADSFVQKPFSFKELSSLIGGKPAP